MIEVELKFAAPEGGIEALTHGAETTKETTNADIYFDTPDYRYSSAENWLRLRNGRFELKVPRGTRTGSNPTDVFDELETDDAIRTYLHIPESTALLRDDLESHGFQPFAHLVTQRTTYVFGEFHIDVDYTRAMRLDSPLAESDEPYNFYVIEIELMVERIEDVPAAQEKIYAFARERGLGAPMRFGKLMSYIKQNKPKQWAVFNEHGFALE